MLNLKNTIVLTTLLLLGISLQGQTDNFVYFNKVYWHPDTMQILSQVVRPIDDGYLVIGGYTTLNNKALYVMKLDLNGELIWFKHLDEGENIKGIGDGKYLLNNDNDFVIVYAKQKPDGGNESHIIKFTESGAILWHKVNIPENGSHTMHHLISTVDGGYAMVGTRQLAGDTTRYCLIKTDGAGNFEWDKTYMLDNSSVAFSIQETPWDGGFIIGGYAYNTTTGTGNYDAWVIKTNYLGDTLWTRTYGDPAGNDCAAFVIPLTTLQEYFFEGKPIEYLLTGCVTISEENFMYLAKLDEFGEIIWEKKYNSLGGYNPSGIQTYPIIVRSSSVVQDRSFLGAFLSKPEGWQQNRIIKFYYNGTIAWHKAITCNPDAHIYIKDMQPTPDGGYVLAGYQYSPSPQKGWVLKIDAQGNTCSPVGCDSTVVVSAVEAGGLPDKTHISLVQLNPNPVKDGGVLTLSHQLPAEFPVAQFTLYNPSGKAVWEHEFNTWDRTKALQLPLGLPAGLYLWQVSYMGEVAGSGKVVVSD